MFSESGCNTELRGHQELQAGKLYPTWHQLCEDVAIVSPGCSFVRGGYSHSRQSKALGGLAPPQLALEASQPTVRVLLGSPTHPANSLAAPTEPSSLAEVMLVLVTRCS